MGKIVGGISGSKCFVLTIVGVCPPGATDDEARQYLTHNLSATVGLQAFVRGVQVQVVDQLPEGYRGGNNLSS